MASGQLIFDGGVMMKRQAISILLLSVIVFVAILSVGTASAEEQSPGYQDRVDGTPLSMFGTYIRAGELIVYPFYEYYYDSDMVYEPDDFDEEGDEEYEGKVTAHEGLIFIAYGINDRLALELEAAYMSAEFEKSDDDDSEVPETVDESGLGDVEGQIRYRITKEQDSKPGIFTYFEYVFPTQEDKFLIGTPDWEFKLGVGAIKTYGFGTMSIKFAVEYELEDDEMAVGELAIEYLKRINEPLQVYVALEGDDEEIEFIPEIQWYIREDIIYKLSVGIGLTAEATDIAPETGLMFRF
jgi:hypothetical protein